MLENAPDDPRILDQLKVEAPGGVRNALVVPMPFVDPKKALAKS
jgi:hypothetical protein